MSVYSIYNRKRKTFHAGVGFTKNPASVYRYHTKDDATKVLDKLKASSELDIVSYAFVFDTLGTPGNRKRTEVS